MLAAVAGRRRDRRAPSGPGNAVQKSRLTGRVDEVSRQDDAHLNRRGCTAVADPSARNRPNRRQVMTRHPPAAGARRRAAPGSILVLDRRRDANRS